VHPPNRFGIKRGHQWDGATVSNRNIFNAKTNGNAREQKVMRGVRTISSIPNERRERDDTSAKEKENRPDELCAESTVVKKR